MRFFFPLLLASLLALVAANWAPEDYEIFGLNDKVRGDLGPETTFYSWLGLEHGPKSTKDAINKAYRKLSRQLHPDKVGKGSRKTREIAEQRFQRLSLVGNILKDQNLKKRYDYFLSNGFPKWKGTGYYYSRFRPGLGFTLAVLYVLISTLQYISLRISRKQDFKRIVSLKTQVKTQAWGGSFIPPLDGSARRVTAENGRDFHVGPTGDVSLIEMSNKTEMVLVPLDEHDINTNPGFKQSFFYRLPVGLWNITLGKLSGRTIENTESYVNPHRAKREALELKEKKKEQKAKAAKKAERAERVELPNGKVIYKRKNGKK
ncbi:DnaJ-domain-containing protein [Metschnikowia bicuspidata var. bicuspidata NRRL YB-4993]|uniref:DnaJ-domain-containing protein n=1 Tax=Metschnikowia bicuspidata var. bicuspidata NRRL YB-4993 TaxID=869754 RepID=A0A1A0HEX1_9ASCO|nr:DnaJ-domain-containing protein [Metschnikowia bicuspidata var. bicuspidata NRRL YB-4993]OBA22437.1 DnaJ-domain-containing protein [Metschnikowia bicuspidata var. bicuspidata NRRL YB-4993]